MQSRSITLYVGHTVAMKIVWCLEEAAYAWYITKKANEELYQHRDRPTVVFRMDSDHDEPRSRRGRTDSRRTALRYKLCNQVSTKMVSSH